MGMNVYVYRNDLGDCTNNGVTSKFSKLCIVNVDGPAEPTEDAPAAELVLREFGFGKVLNVIAVKDRELGVWTMAGGNVVGTSDSRWVKACQDLIPNHPGFVAVHDRVEQ